MCIFLITQESEQLLWRYLFGGLLSICQFTHTRAQTDTHTHTTEPRLGFQMQDVYVCLTQGRNIIAYVYIYLGSFSANYLLCFLCCCFFCPHCMFRVYVDGPFGGPSEEVFNYDVSLCVAGGIGVTPFACVLRALL